VVWLIGEISAAVIVGLLIVLNLVPASTTLS